MPRSALAVLTLLAIFAATGCQSRPKAETATPAPNPAAEAASGWKLDLKVTPDHPRMVQPVTLAVHIADGSGKPVDNAQVTGSLTMKTMDMGKTEVKFEPEGNGTYQGTVKSMDMSGPWNLVVEAAQGGFHALKKFEVMIYE